MDDLDFWQGRDSTADEKGASALLAKAGVHRPITFARSRSAQRGRGLNRDYMHTRALNGFCTLVTRRFEAVYTLYTRSTRCLHIVCTVYEALVVRAFEISVE